jgi:peptidylprolyl isomerase
MTFKTKHNLLIFLATAVTFAFSSPAVRGESLFAERGSDLIYRDILLGQGPEAAVGKVVVIHVTGWLDDGAGSKGEQFLSSPDRGLPVIFKVGTDRVLPAWNRAVVGMKEGGIRLVWTPARLAYGKEGTGNIVKPNADLIFEIDLLEVVKGNRSKPFNSNNFLLRNHNSGKY